MAAPEHQQHAGERGADAQREAEVLQHAVFGQLSQLTRHDIGRVAHGQEDDAQVIADEYGQGER